ncbi:hypothetical protein PPACK8108_LOCUS20595 [Phakopsora pachyrhizi]|uniref:MI domain-containing protein n=1 Tax=Phakopsora pachyrhizi TaxID=170000 RepID=A0AAV0BHF2_PHAPC|nr:hypothetical protein PPACK8108_LOCUS20595 [Phakopsora pachyrhizi]
MEEKYQNIKNEISGNNSDLSSSGSGSNSNTESNNEKVNTGIDFKEAAHKLLKKDLEGFLELELANMAVECCSQQQSFAISYDLLGQTFCNVNQTWAMTFEKDFGQYPYNQWEQPSSQGRKRRSAAYPLGRTRASWSSQAKARSKAQNAKNGSYQRWWCLYSTG